MNMLLEKSITPENEDYRGKIGRHSFQTFVSSNLKSRILLILLDIFYFFLFTDKHLKLLICECCLDFSHPLNILPSWNLISDYIDFLFLFSQRSLIASLLPNAFNAFSPTSFFLLFLLYLTHTYPFLKLLPTSFYLWYKNFWFSINFLTNLFS
jgi:hypothetical protein